MRSVSDDGTHLRRTCIRELEVLVRPVEEECGTPMTHKRITLEAPAQDIFLDLDGTVLDDGLDRSTIRRNTWKIRMLWGICF